MTKWLRKKNPCDPDAEHDPLDDVMDIDEQLALDKQNKELAAFSKDLFQLWDSRGYGKLKIKQLSKHFIALGLANNEDIAISFFKNIIKTNRELSLQEILDFEVTVDTFMNLFKDDNYSVRFLDVLNDECRKKKQRSEQLQQRKQ